MSPLSDPSESALAAAGSALAERGQRLGEADREFSGLLREAHALSATAVARLDQIAAQIESAVQAHSANSPAESREFSRLLLDKHREIIAVVERARADVDAKTVALQTMIDRYRQR